MDPALKLGFACVAFCLSWGAIACRSTAQPAPAVQPANELEAWSASRSPQTLDALIRDLGHKVRALQDQEAALQRRLSAHTGSAPQSAPLPDWHETAARDLREIGTELQTLENELFGVQKIAVELHEFGRPDLQQCAAALAGLRRQWEISWSEISGHAPAE